MQRLSLAVIGAASLMAIPALAQTSTHTTPSQNSSASSAQPMSPGDMQQLQQKIAQDLRNDGYKDVQVVPNSFLVHARNKQNEPVVMIINPDSVFAVTQLPTQTASNPGGTGSGNQSALGGSGSTKQ